MDVAWIVFAFGLGFVAHQLRLPPLVGFLMAGFAIQAASESGLVDTGEGVIIVTLADAGVTMLMFSIGLKLRLGTLARPEVWGTASAHMFTLVLCGGALLLGLGAIGLAAFSECTPGPAAILAFALSFSSTVFAVKIVEAKKEPGALYARTAIGILIVQDIFAVLFLAAAAGKVPSPWALLLLLLIPLRRPLHALMERSGHGELLLLLGVFLAMVLGHACFELVGVKGDLGALIVGMIIGGHPKADELSKTILGLKDLLLIGFFLRIGIEGEVSPSSVGLALLLLLLVPFKFGLFFLLLTRMRLRARTALRSSLALGNYSEFGLIVLQIAVLQGWLGASWLTTLAIALAISFVIGAPLNAAARPIYLRLAPWLDRFETDERHPEETPLEPENARVCVVGMGRVGTGAYDRLVETYGNAVIGIEADPEAAARHDEAGRRVIEGDAGSADFWARANLADADHGFELVLLLTPSGDTNEAIVRVLRTAGYCGTIAALAPYPEDRAPLQEAGADYVYETFAQAGHGFADNVLECIGAAGATAPGPDSSG